MDVYLVVLVIVPLSQKGPQHKLFGQFLRNSGYHSSGCEVLYNGMTGEQLEADITLDPLIMKD